MFFILIFKLYVRVEIFFLFLKVNNLVCWSFNYIYIVNMRLKYVVDIKFFLECMFK